MKASLCTSWRLKRSPLQAPVDRPDAAGFARRDVARLPTGFCPSVSEHPLRGRSVHPPGHLDQRLHRHLPAGRDDGSLPASQSLSGSADRWFVRRGISSLRMRGGAGDSATR